MFKVSRKVDYDLLLLTTLAKKKPGKFVSLKTLTFEKKLPYKFIGQVATKLKAAGILESREGKKGGYRLSRPADYISVAEVIEALEGPVLPKHCIRGENCSCHDFCIQDEIVKPMAQAATKSIQEQTIADLARINTNNPQ